MKRFLLKWAMMVVALVIAAAICTTFKLGLSAKTGSVGDVLQLFIGVAAISVLNATLGRVLKFLTIPLNCLTFGLCAVVINAAMFYIAGTLNLGFNVSSFFSALIGSALYSFFGAALTKFVPESEDD